MWKMHFTIITTTTTIIIIFQLPQIVSLINKEFNHGYKSGIILHFFLFGFAAPAKGSGQWSFLDKVSAIPQFLSFRPAQEDRPGKRVYDHFASSGFMPMSAADAFQSNHKSYYDLVQKKMILNKQAENHYTMTAYPKQRFDANPICGPQESRILPVSNQPNPTIRVAMSGPVLQSHFALTRQDTVGNNVNPQPLGGVPLLTVGNTVNPVSVISTPSTVVGTRDLRNASKSSGAQAQLTIFYAGSVNVYDNVSAEMAQSLMLLASNGSSATQNTTTMIPIASVQAPILSPFAGDGYIGNKSHPASPCSGIPSPISVNSHLGSQSGGGSSGTSELAILKPAEASPSNQSELPKVVSSVGATGATIVSVVALPQARKASLARFLEKRKERVMSTSPYGVSKYSPGCSIPGTDSVSSISNLPFLALSQQSVSNQGRP